MGVCSTATLASYCYILLKMSSATNGDAQPAMIFDSLPYYDNDLEQFPILKEKVEKELAREGRPPQTLHPKVPPESTLFAVRAQRSVVVQHPRVCTDPLARTRRCCRLSSSGFQTTGCSLLLTRRVTSCPGPPTLTTKGSGRKP